MFVNSGKTPAKRASLEVKIVTRILNDKKIYEEISNRASNSQKVMGKTILPGQSFESIMTITIERRELEHFIEQCGKDIWKEKMFVPLNVVGCIDYGLVFDEERHQTGFNLIFSQKSSGNLALLGPKYPPVDKKDIILKYGLLDSALID